MIFYSAYNLPKREDLMFSPSGEELENTYAYEVDKKGMKQLQKTGKTNVYEKIQMFAEETKIENVIQRVIAGDESVLRPNNIYADVSQHPKNMLEAMQQIHNLEKTYNELSQEVKEKYPTLESWVENSGTADWMKLNGYIQETPEMAPVQDNLQTATQTIAKEVKEATPNEP